MTLTQKDKRNKAFGEPWFRRQPIDFDVSGYPDASGVYVIENTKTGGRYVGASGNIRLRLRQHFISLRRGKSPCKRLQSSYDRYGVAAFRAAVLELCDREDLAAREAHWIYEVRATFNKNKRKAIVMPPLPV